jgi:integrase
MLNIKLGRYRGKYCAIWRDERGHRFRHSLGTDDVSLAKTRLAAFQAHLVTKAPAGPLTVETIFKAYMNDRAADDKPTARMKHAWKRLGPCFGPLRPADITKDTSRGYIKARRDQGASDGTIWTEMTYLRTALGFAVREKWLTTVPYIKVPQKPGPKEYHLEREEAARLVGAASSPHVKLFQLALATAGRAGALLGLTWDRVDLERRRIDLRDPDRPVTRKGRARVPINDSLFEALEEAKRGALTPYVIEYGGEQVLSVKKGVGAAGKRAGLKCSPHVLRHTAAVWMAERGVPMEKIAQYLGHNDSRTTERVYARFAPDYMKDAAAALELRGANEPRSTA